MKPFLIVFLVVGLLCCSGCSHSGPDKAAISGTVFLDGKPLTKGTISFTPTEGTTGPTAGAVIANGKYHIDRAKGVVVGRTLVQISSVQPTGRKIHDRRSDDLVDEWAESLPEKYHSKSTLLRSITAGSNVLEFDLKNK